MDRQTLRQTFFGRVQKLAARLEWRPLLTAVVRAYDRGERLEERIRLAHWWDAQLVAAESGLPAATT